MTAGSSGDIRLDHAAQHAPAFLFFGLSEIDVPLLGGTLVPSPDVYPLVATTDANGKFGISWSSWPANVPGCTEFWMQWWIADPGASLGAAASNGLRAIAR